MADVFIGTAGWNIPSHLKNYFSAEGSHLEKYCEKFNCVEINSSFYRDHKFETYQKWSTAVPADFLFSVKLLKYFTHAEGLTETGATLKASLKNISGLGDKWGALLVQLPPKLVFDEKIAERFFSKLKKYCHCPIVLEPRNISWSEQNAVALLQHLNIQKVLADPEPCRISKLQRGALEKELRYFRLHGSPAIYKSSYSTEVLDRICKALKKPWSPTSQAWVIFDNSAYGFATQNAFGLTEKLEKANA